jgi:hypothetical protein
MLGSASSRGAGVLRRHRHSGGVNQGSIWGAGGFAGAHPRLGVNSAVAPPYAGSSCRKYGAFGRADRRGRCVEVGIVGALAAPEALKEAGGPFGSNALCARPCRSAGGEARSQPHSTFHLMHSLDRTAQPAVKPPCGASERSLHRQEPLPDEVRSSPSRWRGALTQHPPPAIRSQISSP